MIRKGHYICLCFLLLIWVAGCSISSDIEQKEVKKETEMVEVQRLNQLENESTVAFTYSKDIRIFKEAAKTAVKEPGIANIIDPMYKVTVGKESYFLWVGNGHGTIMNTKDKQTVYSLLDQSTKDIEQLFMKTYPAIKKDGTLDMASSSNFPLDDNNVGFFIGALNPTPIEKVENGVYIQGVHAHGDRQVFQIFSKVSQGDYQYAAARLEGEKLIIEVTSHKANSGEVSHPYVIHSLSMKENPRYYVVIRNGITEKKEEIFYGIE
ncbi:hypothetical protein [Bacillus sp. 1NLA3E]|uniref:hypothetical protein n=1 Tax=Bacillus sp. 1NLA3E TaxID=666686 RepID=UPI000247E471|nr:hypothetical protein [Bacillus sp. 1NLA3E]AGK54159.1 hypothetical protein B1NLA3E_12055 [Bacillus sp. 1NLA3E]